MQKIINYIGWVGHSNVGDEALYVVNRRFFSKYKLINRHKLYETTVTLFGGGTIFPEWPFGAQINRHNYAFGVGIKDPSFWGEPKRHHIEAIKKCNFRVLTVRGYKSQEILKKYGLQSEVVGDPALSLQPTRYKSTNKKKIIINIGVPAEKMWGNKTDRVLDETVQLCVYLKNAKYQVSVVPFWDKDVSYCKALAAKSGCAFFEDWRSIQKTLDFMSDANIVIGEKLHSLVFSAACHVPFVTIEYDPKCYDFSHSVGLDTYRIRTDKITTKKLIRAFTQLESNRNKVKTILKKNVRHFRKLQVKTVTNITSDINAISEKDLPRKWKYFHYIIDGINKNVLELKYRT